MRPRASRSLSTRAALVASRLGVDVEEGASHSARHGAHPGTGVPSPVPPALSPITVLLGPSGSGKSTYLNRLAQRQFQRGWRIRRESPKALSPACAIDLLCARGLAIDQAMALLTRAGLGEARCFITPASQLSIGQQARLRLLLAMHQGSRESLETPNPELRSLLVLDEFAASLDDLAARGICIMVRRWAGGGPNRHVVLATHRDHLVRWLAPCDAVHFDLQGLAVLAPKAGPPAAPLEGITIEPGTRADLDLLLPYHYRAGRPATVVRVLRAVDLGGAENEPPNLAGVLSVSMPTLNARWRDLAWPARYTSGSKARRARRLNREVRCLSRVIVDPRYRGMGLARRLVGAYLDDPLSPCTESISALGPGAGFHERAGMTGYALPPSLRDARLLDALDHVGVEAHELCAPARVLAHVERRGMRRFLEVELARWAEASRAGAPVRGAEALVLLRRAVRTIAGAPIAFAHTSRRAA